MTPTSIPAPAVTATHHRLPSNQPGFFGSVNHRFVPPLISPRNASAANASTTPNTTAYPIDAQNPGDRLRATKPGLEGACASAPAGRGGSLTNVPSRSGWTVLDTRTGIARPTSPSHQLLLV